MFKLQRLDITGFKSFADHTEIIFTGDGITAIVGPNGCGKSNVADAVAWVLGEQRVKHLRGSDMQDVIFQGSRNRPPNGMAEVIMHLVRDEIIEHEPDIADIDSTLEQIDEQAIALDEALPEEAEVPVEAHGGTTEEGDGHSESEALVGTQISTAESPSSQKIHHKRHWRRRNLALEFAPGEAVSVGRRLYRSGESEYLLNDRLCRLRDIQDLFSGTGLSGGHYAIIEQGRIGQILSAKPMDRRTIIEEAAGITKFRVRQRAAEGRLESARANLSRLSDIISEIDRQVNSLRRQAAKARRYRALRESLRELMRRVYVAEDRKLASLLEETEARMREVSNEERTLAGELAKREEDARNATQAARRLEDELTQARAAAAEAVLHRDRQVREQAYQEEQLAALRNRTVEVQSEIQALSERLALVEAECERLRERDVRLSAEAEESALTLRSAEEAYAGRLAVASDAEIEIERARTELLTQTAVAERLREVARQLEGTLERLAAQAAGLAREGQRATAQHAESKSEAEKLNEEIRIAREHIARLNAEREAAVESVVQGHEAVSDTDADLTRIRDDYSRTKHRLESLNELDKRRAYYSSAVQSIFSSSNAQRDFYVIGTLADTLNVEAKWECAVEGVFGSSLQSIIVPAPDDAARASRWLRENNAGRASFLVAGLHGASDETETLTFQLERHGASTMAYSDEGIGTLRIGDVVGAPRELAAVLNRVLPHKMNARIVVDLDDAIAKSLATGEIYVTLNGDWVASGQLVSVGDARSLEEGAGLLAFKRELRELEGRAEALQQELAVAESAAKEARERLVGLEDVVVLLNEAIGREEREAMARELTAGGLAQEIDRAERHMRVVADDLARLEEEGQDLEQRRVTTQADAETAEGARTAASDAVITASARRAEARREAETENAGLGEQRAAAAAAAERKRATVSELRRLDNEHLDLSSRIERQQGDLVLMTARMEELRLSIEYLGRRGETVAEEREREEKQIADATNSLEQARQRADELSSQLSDLNRQAAEIRDSRAAIEVQRAEAQARLTFVHETCAVELNQSLEDLACELSLEDDFDVEAGHARAEELRERIESFGAINMMALEELADAEQRLLFLSSQRQDIVESIASTEEALREIKRRSRERFRHAFEQINKNFGELFKELFGGGRGEMSLIDADDVLESGIDVIAQPPGKRLQNVLLLSGGEKAMAALALVLGIFHYRPSPFCLLDEVDAPLDEANVGRFTDKVVQMSANTQFIVITHNKRTMEMARALYGVTMEEVGVSKLVSVRFE